MVQIQFTTDAIIQYTKVPDIDLSAAEKKGITRALTRDRYYAGNLWPMNPSRIPPILDGPAL